MTVHFIGAGPGAPDLITLRGLRLIQSCPVVLFAGSLIPREVVAEAGAEARVIDSSALHLDEIIAVMAEATARGEDIARLHSGDPSLYGAIAEQIRRLRGLGIAYDICPGVPSYAAAAAALGNELTLPEVCQTVILTRTSVRASPMPAGEDLESLGRSGALLAIHLSIANLAEVEAKLTPLYGADCPVAVVYRASWPDQTVVRGTLADIAGKIAGVGITRTALILVGRGLGSEDFANSRLYAADCGHAFRSASA
ncbi:precorrin-4 C(11)-methyltransferase [Rhodospirillum rubrum]|uniref:Precorrin-4 C11-methyltransferase n=1 Tax=Rhodospirillum rubrum (strain ATCC 11170 / ATH 1.1.1 / DSM 467 / LMG 4362 / NCIMB 8255 / S1) TaxID=269796 RepID=Q2RNW7_RHORT|nr:precorrin-4 C(11)-methyltransferase [Rhodospirillum rubrum]ABC24178.1 precorrin-4 C11-methyltransferase [Rhodospirillum rubrum ATCC 11170]AEO49929.1 precorrin-4 C11-methyltransferase [Rhodospirillum rubrum F11]MBK5955891.1 precorrin-4 C(11)-methyltransferase [Rhodospirillum rubrum]QXG80115.1 precorrin-4 C(11)-methyltransferase [Rhodospirillum rubrum]